MWKHRGAAREHGFAYFHAYCDPFPEFPAFTHVNEAVCLPHYVLAPHSHRVMELCYIYRGRAEWTNGDDVTRLEPGDFFINEPGEVHGGRPDPADPNHNFAIGFDPRQLPLGSASRALIDPPRRELVGAIDEASALSSPMRSIGRRRIPGGRGAERIYRRILAEVEALETADRTQRDLSLVMVQALLVELFILLTRCLLAQRDHAVAPAAVPTRADIAGLVRWLPTRLADPPSLGEMAEVAALSPTHLVVVFKDQLGRTPMDYFARLRVDEAARRLATTDASVTDIALDLGFSSSQHFSVVFKRHLGRTPSEWRERPG